MQPTKGKIPASAQGLGWPEGSRVVADRRAHGDDAAGEVVGHGTYEEDGPVTWEALTFPREERPTGSRAPISDGTALASARGNPGKKKTLAAR